jgi:hypothetical protein
MIESSGLAALKGKYCLAKSPPEHSMGGFEPYVCTEPVGHSSEQRHIARHIQTGEVYAEWPDIGPARNFEPLVEVVMYQARCTNCGTIEDEYDDVSAWANPETPRELVVENFHWVETVEDGEVVTLLCPKCAADPT